ncbi:hypothetical protein TNCT_624721 [Trichonephila clavata]|uniref:Uncharacterized protein n=1 Tax=Trichonephila clavata TaxID=2740835 RepID=A0A8X6M332_TRICU|nr:hypothetical protein TNCT_624721 [Trichonephila clavata]
MFCGEDEMGEDVSKSDGWPHHYAMLVKWSTLLTDIQVYPPSNFQGWDQSNSGKQIAWSRSSNVTLQKQASRARIGYKSIDCIM